jgi:hypothetical protein
MDLQDERINFEAVYTKPALSIEDYFNYPYWFGDSFHLPLAALKTRRDGIFLIPGCPEMADVDALYSIWRAVHVTIPAMAYACSSFITRIEDIAKQLGCDYILFDFPPVAGSLLRRIATMADAVISIASSAEDPKDGFSQSAIERLPQRYACWMDGDESDPRSGSNPRLLGAKPFAKTVDVKQMPGFRVHPSGRVNWIAHIQNRVSSAVHLRETVQMAAEKYYKEKDRVAFCVVKEGATEQEWLDALAPIVRLL